MSDLKKFSAFWGNNHLLTQGAGGNTSKKYNGLMDVKASGTWLADASKKNIFTTLNLKKTKLIIDKDQDSFDEAIISNSELKQKPSIETSFHALLSNKIVVHLHPINLLALLVLKNAYQLLKTNMKDLHFIFISYYKPGLFLAKKILNETSRKRANIIFLQNHGIIITGDSFVKINENLNLVLKKNNMPSRPFNHNLLKKKDIDTSKINMRFPKYDIVNSLAFDEISYEICKNKKNIFYPDQIVYLGKKIFCVESIDEMNAVLILNPLFIVFKNVGVFVANFAKSDVDELLRGHAELLLKLNSNDQLNPLNDKDILEIENWDSEKYRQTVVR